MQTGIFPYNLTTTESQTGQSLKTLKPHNLITLHPHDADWTVPQNLKTL